jgi:hypothetical protein
LKVSYDEPPSNFAVKFSLRRYSEAKLVVEREAAAAAAAEAEAGAYTRFHLLST